MGRKLTPEEISEFQKQRRKEIELSSQKLGMTPEQLEKFHRKARESVVLDNSWEKELDKRNRNKAGIE